MRPPLTAYLALLAALQLTGCAMLRTDKSQYAGTDRMLAKGNYSAAAAQIEAAKTTAIFDLRDSER